MKTLFLSILFITTIATAQAEEINMRFWDGTFAYNELTVKSFPHQSNLLTLKLSGSLINLGQQIEGLGPVWSSGDVVEVILNKKDCLISGDKKEIECTKAQQYVHNLTWAVNSKIKKSYTGIITSLKVVANKNSVNFSFTIPSDEFFTPANEDISVSFRNTFF